MELERFLHQEALGFFDEGYVFGEEGSGFERMNLACPTRVMMEGLERLHQAMRKRIPFPKGTACRGEFAGQSVSMRAE